MKVVLLAGGRGSRLSEETQLRPKPMVEIGGHPMSLAHHDDVLVARLSRLHHLPGVPRLFHQGLEKDN
jgi:GTP:adenosylcobinamide-phosphate guanylyltransferase